MLCKILAFKKYILINLIAAERYCWKKWGKSYK